MTFYFAWVDPETAFNAGTHSVEDEDVYAFDMHHSEGDFPMLQIDLRNPRANLLDPGRKLWMWFSMDGDPIFFGRLVAAPEKLTKEIVRLNFIARPAEYDTIKEALADTMRVLPYFDPVWLNDQRLAEPDVVLESRAELWHIDRLTHEVTTSSIIGGEDGTVVFTEDEILYDSVDVNYGATPLRRVTVNAQCSWDQVAQGTLNFTNALENAFDGRISSYTGQGLQSSWPKPFESLRGGWAIGRAASVRRIDGKSRPSRVKMVKILPPPPENALPGSVSATALSPPVTAQFFAWEFKSSFPLDYDVKRKRVEKLTFTLEGDTQPIVVEPGKDEATLITLSSRSVGVGDEPPIGDLRRNSYFKTDRGKQSVQYLLLVARAKLLARARAVDIKFETSLALGLDLSCRKNAQINDPRLPAGVALGKITEYRLKADGGGKQRAIITIGCTIGEGNEVEELGGDPTYVAEGYVDVGYQIYSDSTFSIESGDVTFASYDDTEVVDDGIDFLNLQVNDVLLSFTVANDEATQSALLNATFQDIPAAVEALNAIYTEVTLSLRPLTGGPFETDFEVEVSDLMIPQTIEL